MAQYPGLFGTSRTKPLKQEPEKVTQLHSRPELWLDFFFLVFYL